MRGRIAQASGGTLFLDEIGDMPLHMQTRLLRVLEEQEVTPLGGALPFKVDVRVVCASHRNLRDLLQRGEFREDLYYRLNGVTIELPALALRRDKELLIRQCIARESHGAPAAIETAALHRLLAYRWPGNIRELRNTIRAALALCDGAVIRVGDLPADIRLVAAEACGNRPHISRLPGPGAAAAAVPARPGRVFDSPDRDGLLRVIEQHGWVMSRVACHFGISRNTLYRKIKQFGIGLARPANAGAGGRERLKR
jgi:transcriptional regulator of acetoin/glycerol metabolism